MGKNEGITKELVKVVGKAGGYEALTEVTDRILDGALEDGVLKEIPIVRAVVGLVRAGLGVGEVIFMRKLRAFLEPAKTIPQEKRDKFIADMEKDPDLMEKVGTSLFVLLDRLEDLEKPVLLGRVFGAYLRAEITFEVFQRMARVIDRCFIEDLWIWVFEPDRADKSGVGALDLMSCGVIESYVVGSESLGRGHHKWTDFGRQFAKLVVEPGRLK